MGEGRSVVEAFYEAFSRGDLEAARATMSDDIENVDPTGTIRGWEAFRQFIQTFKDASPDCRLVARRFVEDGNLVANEGSFEGTFTNALRSPAGELPPTGQRFELPFAEFNEIEDGRIKRHTVYYDQMALLTALGAMQPPGAGGARTS